MLVVRRKNSVNGRWHPGVWTMFFRRRKRSVFRGIPYIESVSIWYQPTWVWALRWWFLHSNWHRYNNNKTEKNECLHLCQSARDDKRRRCLNSATTFESILGVHRISLRISRWHIACICNFESIGDLTEWQAAWSGRWNFLVEVSMEPGGWERGTSCWHFRVFWEFE